MTNLHQLREHRAAIIDWMTGGGFTHAFTLNTERELTLARLNDIFASFCHRYDKLVLGRNLKQADKNERLRAIAFPEKLSSNAHLHAVVDIGPAIAILGSEEQAIQLAAMCWRKATRGSGSLWPEAEPDSGWGRYITKCFDGTLLLAADYWPH